MAVRVCFHSGFGDILRVRRGSAAPVLRLLLRERRGEAGIVTERWGEESQPPFAMGYDFYCAFDKKTETWSLWHTCF